MPNWCDTTYCCVGDKKQIMALKKVLDKNRRRKNPLVKNGFSNMWLGCIITALGYNWEKYRCRGEITDYIMASDGILTIYQMTAWCEQEGFRQVIEDKYPGIKVYHKEEEPGCEVYYHNDIEGVCFPERYLLDSYEDTMYWETIEEAVKYVSDLVGYSVEPDVEVIDAALKKYQEQKEENGEDCFYTFHEFTVIDE